MPFAGIWKWLTSSESFERMNSVNASAQHALVQLSCYCVGLPSVESALYP